MLVRLLASYLYVAADQELTFRVRWLTAKALWTKFDINALTKGAEDFDKQVRRMPKETSSFAHCF